MSLVLLRRTWAAQRVKLIFVALGLAIWGFLMPVVYAEFGVLFHSIIESGLIPKELSQFGGGDVFSLPGAIALGFIHPIAIVLVCVFAVGFPVTAVAGERQRGTLEVILARPLARRRLYGTLLVAAFGFVTVAIAAFLAGAVAGAAWSGVAGELDFARVPLLWLNGTLLYAAIGAIALAASVSFDRLTPALGVTLAIVLVSYFFQVLGSLWPDAQGLQPWSLFHYLSAKAVLTGQADLSDLGVLAAVALVAIAVALVVFPHRDLAAPA